MNKGDADKNMDKGAATKAAPDVKGTADVKSKAGDSKTNDSAQAPAGAKSAQPTASEKSSTSTTTGQGAAAGSAKLSTEQRTKITTVFKQHKVEPARLNVSVSVGTRVPESVRFYPIPTEVVVIYPEWRGYDYILVGDQILIIDPRSHEIVAILDA